MRVILPILVAMIAWPCAVQAADIYRCPGAAGAVSYQATRCTGGSALDLPPLNSLGDPLRPGEKALLEAPSRARAGTASVRPASDQRPAERSQAERCLQKRQQMEAVQAKLRRGYRPAEGERLRRRRDDHAEYLRAFCD